MDPKQPPLFEYESKEISYSAIAEYLRCPLRYKYNYIDNITELKKPSFYFQLGSLLHRILASYFRETQQNVKTSEDIFFVLQNEWKNIRFFDKQEENYWWEKTKSIIYNFLGTIDDKKTAIAVEKSFKANIGEYFIKGIIDRIDITDLGEYEIVDYKLGSDVNQDDYDSYKDNIQAFFYYIGISNGLGIEPRRFFYHLLIPNSKIEIDFKNTIMDSEIKKLVELINVIKSETQFNPKRNIYCQDCLYQCPLYPNREFTY